MPIPIREPISIPEPILILESIPEPIPILKSIPEPILESIPIPEPIPELIPKTYSGPIIRNRFQKTAELAGIDSDKKILFPITTPYHVIAVCERHTPAFPGKSKKHSIICSYWKLKLKAGDM